MYVVGTQYGCLTEAILITSYKMICDEIQRTS